MGYQDLKRRLESSDLIPSQLPLREGLDEKLSALGKAGVSTMEDLLRALHGSRGPASLAAKSGVSEAYLVLLQRTVKGFRPRPVPLADYPGLDGKTVEALAGTGIRDSAGLHEASSTRKARAALAGKAGIAVGAVEEIAELADLSRILWVGATFARVLHAAGYRSAAGIAAAELREERDR